MTTMGFGFADDSKSDLVKVLPARSGIPIVECTKKTASRTTRGNTVNADGDPQPFCGRGPVLPRSLLGLRLEHSLARCAQVMFGALTARVGIRSPQVFHCTQWRLVRSARDDGSSGRLQSFSPGAPDWQAEWREWASRRNTKVTPTYSLKPRDGNLTFAKQHVSKCRAVSPFHIALERAA
jgi:hypothetical protein